MNFRIDNQCCIFIYTFRENSKISILKYNINTWQILCIFIIYYLLCWIIWKHVCCCYSFLLFTHWNTTPVFIHFVVCYPKCKVDLDCIFLLHLKCLSQQLIKGICFNGKVCILCNAICFFMITYNIF